MDESVRDCGGFFAKWFTLVGGHGQCLGAENACLHRAAGTGEKAAEFQASTNVLLGNLPILKDIKTAILVALQSKLDSLWLLCYPFTKG